MAVTESVADYLEAIMVLQAQKSRVRAVVIANYFGYSRPTVSQTLKAFRSKGYVEVGDDGFIRLTEQGRQIAQDTYDRHLLLTDVLMAIGVSEETAKIDACKLEHDISDETYQCLRAFFQKRT